MMSGDEFEAVRAAEQLREDAAAKNKFIEVFEGLSRKSKKLIPAQFSMICKALSADKITVDDAMLACLKGTFGENKLRKFKFRLLSNFYDLPVEEALRKEQVIEQRIKILSSKWQQELDRWLQNIIELINAMSPQQLLAVFEKVDEIRAKFNSKKPSEIYDLLTPFQVPSFFLRKGIKAATRNINHAAIKSNIDSARLEVFDAVYARLTFNIGEHDPNSYKFLLVLAICGFTFTYENGCIQHKAPNTEKEKFLERLILSNKEGQIVQALIDKMTAIKKTQKDTLLNVVDDCLQACRNGKVTKEKLINVITEAKREKESNLSVLSFASIKASLRSGPVTSILERLQNISEFTVLNALQEILTLVGDHGPHSFKYKVLEKLFPDLNPNQQTMSAEKSHATIEYFLAQLAERKQLEEDQEMQDVTQEKRRQSGSS